jgi:hypothetical protein
MYKHGIFGEPGPYSEESQGAAGNPARVRRDSRNHRDADNGEGQLICNFEPLPARGVSVECESRASPGDARSVASALDSALR